MQVLLGAGKGLHVKAQRFQGSFGGFRCILFRLQQLSVALLLSGQPPLQLCNSILKRGSRGSRQLLRFFALLFQPSGEAPGCNEGFKG
jgi:hypothetical protein